MQHSCFKHPALVHKKQTMAQVRAVCPHLPNPPSLRALSLPCFDQQSDTQAHTLLCFTTCFLICSLVSISSVTSSAAALIHPHQVLWSCACSRHFGFSSHFFTSFHRHFLPPTEHLPPAGLHTSRHLGIRVSSIQAAWPLRLSLLLISITSTLSSPANAVFLSSTWSPPPEAYLSCFWCCPETPLGTARKAGVAYARNHVLRCQIIIILASTVSINHQVRVLYQRGYSYIDVCACAIARGGMASVLRMRCADRKPRRYNPGYAPAHPELPTHTS